MEKTQTYSSIVKDLKMDYPKLTDYEALNLAIQIQRNQILVGAFNVSYNDSYPSALTSIAIALGYTGGQFQDTITEVLKRNEK